MRAEEENLKQKLGSIEKDINELTKICSEQKKKIEKAKQTYDFRLNWAMEQRGRKQSSSSEAEAEARTQAERRSSEHDLDKDPEEGRPSRKSS